MTRPSSRFHATNVIGRRVVCLLLFSNTNLILQKKTAKNVGIKMCKACHSREIAMTVKAKFEDNQFIRIPLCDKCLQLTVGNIVAICRVCGAIEFWSKEHYARRLGIPNDDKISALITEDCLGCSEKQMFFEV